MRVQLGLTKKRLPHAQSLILWIRPLFHPHSQAAEFYRSPSAI